MGDSVAFLQNAYLQRVTGDAQYETLKQRYPLYLQANQSKTLAMTPICHSGSWIPSAATAVCRKRKLTFPITGLK